MKKWDVFAIGDVNIDLIVPGVEKLPPAGTELIIHSMRTFVGGGAAIFAIGAAKLGLNTLFQGIIGRDHYGLFIRKEFKNAGVDDMLLQDIDGPTGISICFTSSEDRCFVTFPGSNAEFNPETINLEEACRTRHIHLTGYQGESNHEKYKLMLNRLRTLHDVTISMDVGWDPTGTWTERIYEILPMIDVMLMNEIELLYYTHTKTVLEGIRRIGELTEIAVVKLGEKGSLACHRGIIERAKPISVMAVDPTGAGDSFNAGFIDGFLQKRPLQECLRRGNICGAMSVTALGGNTAFPTKKQLESLINST